MISSSHDIREFIRNIEDKDYFDMMYAAEQEATEAERQFYRSRKADDTLKEDSDRYVDMLKDFISFMRSSLKSKGAHDDEHRLFYRLYKRLEKRKHEKLHFSTNKVI